ncbi:MAG: TrkA family potassium uptake protein [bacterium]|nr:TrkA family potassium uptake protein [bacterium]
MRIVILGCGRVGARLASQLDAEGHKVTIIDENRQAFQHLDENFKGTILVGHGLDDAVIREAELTKIDAFIAVTNSDNMNLMAAQFVKEKFGINRSIARVYDPKRAAAFKEIGIITVCPTIMITEMLKETLFPKISGKKK